MTYSASDAALVRAVSVLMRRIGTGGDGNLLGFTRTSTHAHWWAHLRVLCTRPRARCRLLRSHTAQAAARIASNLHVMTLGSAWSPHDGPWYRCGGHGGDHAKTRDHHTERYDARIAHFRELANLFDRAMVNGHPNSVGNIVERSKTRYSPSPLVFLAPNTKGRCVG